MAAPSPYRKTIFYSETVLIIGLYRFTPPQTLSAARSDSMPPSLHKGFSTLSPYDGEGLLRAFGIEPASINVYLDAETTRDSPLQFILV